MREPTDFENWHPFARRFAFLAKPRTRRNFVWLFALGLAVTSVLGFFVTPKKYAPWDFFASWSLWGFLSYCTVVLMSWPMFRLTARKPGYYNETGWTGGFEYDWKLEPTIEPEDHGDELHTLPPLETEPEADPYAVMPTDKLADTLEEGLVEPLRKRGRLSKLQAERRRQGRNKPSNTDGDS